MDPVIALLAGIIVACILIDAIAGIVERDDDDWFDMASA